MAYFANGTDGEILGNQCGKCPLDDHHCPVVALQMIYNYDQVGNDKLRDAMNVLVNEKGICQVRISVLAAMPIKVEPETLQSLFVA